MKATATSAAMKPGKRSGKKCIFNLSQMTEAGDEAYTEALQQIEGLKRKVRELVELLNEEELIRLRVRAIKRGLTNLSVTLSIELNRRDPKHHKRPKE